MAATGNASPVSSLEEQRLRDGSLADVQRLTGTLKRHGACVEDHRRARVRANLHVSCWLQAYYDKLYGDPKLSRLHGQDRRQP